MKKTIVLFAVLAALSFSAAAQNLNPEVRVTNDYMISQGEVSKLDLPMAVPDSLTHFDYHFDYSVSDSPYKGAYEFSPYAVTITPAFRPYDGRKLFLKAGAGFVFKPELDFVWAPLDTKKASLNVFASADGYWGNYRRIGLTSYESEAGEYTPGYDFAATAGLDGRFSLGGSDLRVQLGYDGFYNAHEAVAGGAYHSPWLQARFGSEAGRWMAYDLVLTGRYISDMTEGPDPLNAFELGFIARTAPGIKGWPVTPLLDLDVAANSWYTAVSIKPHATVNLGGFDIDAGVSVGYAGRFTIHPDVTVKYKIPAAGLELFAGAVGKDHHMQYSDYKSRYHFYSTQYGDPSTIRETADFFLGVSGHAGTSFQYKLDGGLRMLENAPFWAMEGGAGETLFFQPCNLWHASLKLSWSSENFAAEGKADFTKPLRELDPGVFAPSMLTGGVEFGYNWLKRIYAGMSASGALRRTAVYNGAEKHIPGYVDLGVRGEYKFSRKLSFWLKGSNLLAQDIRISPMVSECAPAVVAGVILNF